MIEALLEQGLYTSFDTAMGPMEEKSEAHVKALALLADLERNNNQSVATEKTKTSRQLTKENKMLLDALKAMYDRYYAEGYASGSPLDQAFNAITKARGE